MRKMKGWIRDDQGGSCHDFFENFWGSLRGWKQIEMCLNLPNGRFGFYR